MFVESEQKSSICFLKEETPFIDFHCGKLIKQFLPIKRWICTKSTKAKVNKIIKEKTFPFYVT